MANPTLFQLATTTVGSGGASNVYLTSIPQVYTDLLIVASVRSGYSSSNDFIFWLNTYTGSGYTSIDLIGNGSSASSVSNRSGIGQTTGGQTEPTSATANTFSSHSIYIPNYTSSNYKSISVDSVYENNGTTAVATFAADLWSSTAAINQINFGIGASGGAANSFTQYSTFTLYGVRNY